jgi:hypothetical protein
MFDRLGRALVIIFMLVSLTSALFAQSYKGRNNTAIQPSVMVPYPTIPVTGAQYGMTPTSATPLTVPATALYAIACARTAIVNYTTSGTTPTGSLGLQIAVGACKEFDGPAMLAAVQLFSASGLVDVEYFK